MKKFIRSIFFFSIVIPSLASCDLHSSDNGVLDNFWYLRQVDTLSTCGVNDYVSQKVFWSFIDKMMQVEGPGPAYLFRFEHSGDSLIVHTPYTNPHSNANIVVPDSSLSVLNKYGLHLQPTGTTPRESFYIEELNHNRMTLSSSEYRLHFIRY